MLGSIRRRLTLLVLTGVTLVWIITLLSSFKHATREVQAWEDARLIEIAQLLGVLNAPDLEQLARTRIDARFEIPYRPGDTSDPDADERNVLFQVLDPQGKLLAASAVLPHGYNFPPAVGDGTRPWSATIAGEDWRVYAWKDPETERTIRVMQPSNTRSDLATGAAWHISQPLVLALPVLALLIWWGIGHSLSPLRVLSEAIGTRRAGSLAPVAIEHTPTEVRPLVDAINRLVQQLGHSIERERAFTADAAHELKTPLAAIRVQAQVAMTTPDAAAQQLAMERVVQGVDRSARLASQLLLLARLDVNERIPVGSVTLDEQVTIAVADHLAQADARRITLACELSHTPPALADATLVGILLANLLDNAIKYGREEGQVHIATRHDDDSVWLTVCDDGPGVPADDRERLTDRFFRGRLAHTATGSGLGLSIVARIVAYFDAQLRFLDGIDGRGLAVEIEFRRNHLKA